MEKFFNIFDPGVFNPEGNAPGNIAEEFADFLDGIDSIQEANAAGQVLLNNEAPGAIGAKIRVNLAGFLERRLGREIESKGVALFDRLWGLSGLEHWLDIAINKGQPKKAFAGFVAEWGGFSGLGVALSGVGVPFLVTKAIGGVAFVAFQFAMKKLAARKAAQEAAGSFKNSQQQQNTRRFTNGIK